MRELEIIRGNGNVIRKNVIAWRPLPDPYRPERSTE